jgi:hypothetical protein
LPDPPGPEDAIELIETLTFISDWFDGPDAELLAASFRRVMGTSGYEFDDPRRHRPLRIPAQRRWQPALPARPATPRP